MCKSNRHSLDQDTIRVLLARAAASEKRGYSVSEASKYVGIAEGTLRNWMSKGLMPYSKIGMKGGKPVILKDTLDRLLEAKQIAFSELLLGNGGDDVEEEKADQ
jgi:excisionase family DNA binding protein